MDQRPGLPPYITVFGPDGNCTLALCPVEYSVYGYRPNLAANAVFLALYVISGGIHLYLGIRWKKWFFMGCMLAGALNAVIGYAGRIMMWYNPFNFVGFMMQIGECLFLDGYERGAMGELWPSGYDADLSCI